MMNVHASSASLIDSSKAKTRMELIVEAGMRKETLQLFKVAKAVSLRRKLELMRRR